MSLMVRDVLARLASAAGASLIGFLSSASGAVLRTLRSILAERSRLLDFAGADPTGATDSTAAVLAWIAYGLATGARSTASAGTYKVTEQVVQDWALAANAGVIFEGDGINRTVFDLTGVAASPAWLMTDSGGGKAEFYGTFRDIGIKGNVAGTVFQMGLDTYADAFNEFRLKVQVSNANATASACAIELNGLYNCDIFAVGNCSGHGDALRLRQTQFSRIFGSFGNADVSMHLTGGYTYGNTFNSIDAEVVNTCVVIDSATAVNNTWVGGQFVWSNGSGPSVAAINATAGNGNRFIGVNYGSPGALVTGQVGVTLDGKGIGAQIMGGLIVSPVAGDAASVVNSVTGYSAIQSYQCAGLVRWEIARDNAAETGANVGSDLIVTRYTDAGVSIDNPFYITRSNGQATIAKLAATAVGFFGNGVVATRPTVTGSRGTETAANASLRAALVSLGLIADDTTA